MTKVRKWTEEKLVEAVASSTSIRGVLIKLGLKPAGGNYSFIGKSIRERELDISHFKGAAWNKGLKWHTYSRPTLKMLLVQGSLVQSFKLKQRLIKEGFKKAECELCGWAVRSIDGRVPVELDHINGDRTDNRIANLRILCPNCHSLQPTHRGKNIGRLARVV